MIDPHFHHCIAPIGFADLCDRAGHAALARGDIGAIEIVGASGLLEAVPGAISFAANREYAEELERTDASIVLVTEALEPHVSNRVSAVICEDPYGVFIDLLNVLYPDDTRRVVQAMGDGSEPRLEDGVSIGPGAVVGPGAEIGQGTVLGANCVVGAGVTIGRNCVIGAGVSIECAHIGDGVVLQAGVAIGAEGFGFQLNRERRKKIPQLGRVIIQDGVEIGANTTVDRGTLGDTVIGEGTKIDNLVQIGHNCRIGRNCVISGMCGLSGSTILEDGVVMGGGAGTAGHLTIGEGTLVLARSGVSHSFPARSNIAGAPAQDVRMWKREIAVVRRLSKGDKK